MSQQQQHTREPWNIRRSDIGTEMLEIYSETTGDVVLINAEDQTNDWPRIVACVNAMAGIEDPQKFVDGSRELVKEGVKAKVERDQLKKQINAVLKFIASIEADSEKEVSNG